MTRGPPFEYLQECPGYFFGYSPDDSQGSSQGESCVESPREQDALEACMEGGAVSDLALLQGCVPMSEPDRLQAHLVAKKGSALRPNL